MARTYSMTAEENYDGSRVSYIAGLSSYTNVSIGTDQNYQGIQWDPVRRNLMYMYTEKTPSTPATNTTGHTIWNGETTIISGAAVDHSQNLNASVAVKNIDNGDVTFYSTYNPANVVPAGIGGSDGTYRRYTADFQALPSIINGNGPGMTDPYTGNFWVNSQSCQLYCFRLEDNYAMNISPLFPVIDAVNIVKPVGFTNTGATSPWTFAREVARQPFGATHTAYLYLVPREFTAAEVSADYLLAYATYAYPLVWDSTWGDSNLYTIYNREVFDSAGNMYVFSCNPIGAKDFRLHKFSSPTSAPYGGPTVGGGFTNITPWDATSGPNSDATGYVLSRKAHDYETTQGETSDIIPMYMPATDDLVLIEKFFPTENTIESSDPALMSWSCTYVRTPSGTPTYDHHSAFVKGYMTADWRTTDITGAAYAVKDAFEVNSYLGQSDYSYDYDYTKRWFFFVCTRMIDGVSDEKPRIVMVEYDFLYGNAPTVSQIVDEQGWDDTYSSYAPDCNFYQPYDASPGSAVASSMMTTFNTDSFTPMWDIGVHDSVTNTFWWSGGATDFYGALAIFSRFDSAFYNRTKTGSNVPDGTDIAATPPFMKLSFIGTDDSGDNEDDLILRCWGYSLDGHDFYVLRVGGSETIVYDLTTGMWSEWASPGRPNWRAHVGQNWVGAATATMSRDFGSDVIAGDDSTGVLWMLDPTAGVDDNPSTGTTPFMRRINSGIVLRGRDAIPCNAVQLTVSLGAPVLTGATMQLRTSDDFGDTWVDQGVVMIDPGNYEQVIEYRSLGLMVQPGRIFEFTDEGAAVRISGADLR